MNKKIKEMIITSLFIAIVAISTLVIQIPTPVGGYIHIGDSAILIIAAFFGRKKGAIAGGAGSALADLISGYPQYIIPSLIIKFVMGYVAGSMSNLANEKNFFKIKNILTPFIVEAIMVSGYYIVAIFFSGSFMGALASIPSNAIQGIGGILIYMIIGQAFIKVDVGKLIEKI